MSGAKAVSVELVKAEAEVPLWNLCFRRAKLLAAQTVANLVVAGLQLKAEKKKLRQGEWEPFVQTRCEFTARSAHRFIGLGEGVKARLLKSDTVSDLKLLETAPADLSPADQATLLAAVSKITDGETITELYRDFGIVKLPQGAGLRGLQRTYHPRHPKDYDPNAPAEAARDGIVLPLLAIDARWRELAHHMSDSDFFTVHDLLLDWHRLTTAAVRTKKRPK